MAADEEGQILRFASGTVDHLHKTGGVHAAARRIQKDFATARVLREQVEPGGHDLAHLTIGVAIGAFQKLCSYGVCMLVARFADVIDENLHALSTIGDATRAAPHSWLACDTIASQSVVLDTSFSKTSSGCDYGRR